MFCKFFRLCREIFMQYRESRAAPLDLDDDDEWEHA